MPTREEYNACMRPYITGKKPKEQRKLDFCVGAKLCSSKSKTKEEAERLCRQPKPPREPKEPSGQKRGRGKVCSPQSIETIASCLITHTNFDVAVTDQQLRESLSLCMCGKREKKLSKAEQAVMSLDADQREALVQFMADHGTSARHKS